MGISRARLEVDSTLPTMIVVGPDMCTAVGASVGVVLVGQTMDLTTSGRMIWFFIVMLDLDPTIGTTIKV